MGDVIFKKCGEDVRISETAMIKNPNLTEFGNHVSIDMGVYCSTKMVIGDYVHIAPYVCVIGGADSELIMKDFSGISAGCKILCGSDDFMDSMMNPQIPIKYRNPIIGSVFFEKFACIGVNCVVMPNVIISEGSVVGAGSIVTKTTDPWTLYIGSPAKPIKLRNKCKILQYAKELGYE